MDVVINAFKCLLYKFSMVLIKMPRDSITFMDASYKTLHILLLFVFCGLTHSFLMTKGEKTQGNENYFLFCR